MHIRARCSGDVMIFNKNSSLLPRKKNKINKKTSKNARKAEKRRRKEFSRIERDFSDSHFTRLAPWRSPRKKKEKTNEIRTVLESFGIVRKRRLERFFGDRLRDKFQLSSKLWWTVWALIWDRWMRKVPNKTFYQLFREISSMEFRNYSHKASFCSFKSFVISFGKSSSLYKVSTKDVFDKLWSS